MSAVLTLTGGGFGTCTVGWVTRVPFSLGRLRGIQLSPLGTPGTARLSRGEVTVMATLVTKELQVAQGTAQPGRCWLIPCSKVSVLLGGPYGDFLSPSSLLA